MQFYIHKVITQGTHQHWYVVDFAGRGSAVQMVKLPDKLERGKRLVKLTRMDLGTNATCDESSTFPNIRLQETKRGYCSCTRDRPYEIWDKH